MKNRTQVLDLMKALPEAVVAEHEEVMRFLENKRLYGHGLGWVDVHLLASASLTRSIVWTMDQALKRAVDEI
jgi:hypothetical protein